MFLLSPKVVVYPSGRNLHYQNQDTVDLLSVCIILSYLETSYTILNHCTCVLSLRMFLKFINVVIRNNILILLIANNIPMQRYTSFCLFIIPQVTGSICLHFPSHSLFHAFSSLSENFSTSFSPLTFLPTLLRQQKEPGENMFPTLLTLHQHLPVSVPI